MPEQTTKSHRGVVHEGAKTKPSFDRMQDPRFHDQREKVLQLLRDWKLPYSTGRASIEGEDTASHIGLDGFTCTGSSWPLNAEVTRRWGSGPFAESFRLVEEELSWMARFMPYAYQPLRRVFLHDATGDADYERLKKKAERFEESRQLLDEVETALYVLTMRLIDKELYAVFGERVIRKTRRRQTMEESYREIHRVFEGWCRKLELRHRHYRNKALENTAVRCEVYEEHRRAGGALRRDFSCPEIR